MDLFARRKCQWILAKSCLILVDLETMKPALRWIPVMLEAQGFRVGMIAQPDWQSTEAIEALGEDMPLLAAMRSCRAIRPCSAARCRSRSRTASSRLRIVRVAMGLKLPAVLSLLSTLAMGMGGVCLRVCLIHAPAVPWESPTTGAGLSGYGGRWLGGDGACCLSFD